MTNQLSHINLFSDVNKVTLRRVFKADQGWIMESHGQSSAVCPACQSISRSRPSRYWLSLQDLPVQGTQVILRLRLGRWRCRNAGCEPSAPPWSLPDIVGATRRVNQVSRGHPSRRIRTSTTAIPTTEEVKSQSRSEDPHGDAANGSCPQRREQKLKLFRMIK
jgi:transposase